LGGKPAEEVRPDCDPEFQAGYMIERGLEPVVNTPQEFRAFLIVGRARAERIVRAAGEGAM
jgi:tripartite-type tricarboxylate transporter receptor subunit TctC